MAESESPQNTNASWLIRRHGGWFRPGAQGYTLKLSDAGLFTLEEARLYLDVEGLDIHKVTEFTEVIALQLKTAIQTTKDLQSLLDLCLASTNA